MLEVIPESGSAGFLTYAVGDQYRQKGRLLVNALRLHMPEMPVHVHTDLPEAFPDTSTSAEIGYDKARRIEFMRESPFERTVYIDGDAFVVQACFDLFRLLRFKELALVGRPTRPAERQGDIPFAFPSFYSGVIAYRRTPRAIAALTDWERQYQALREDNPHQLDELPLRSALYAADINMLPLTSHYNFCIDRPQLITDPAEVKIIHGHAEDMEDFEPVIRQLRSAAPNFLLYDPA